MMNTHDHRKMPPLFVFIDTQVYREMSFDWTHPIFASLKERISNNSIVLIKTDIVTKEIHSQINGIRNEIKQQTVKIRRNSGLFNRHYKEPGKRNIYRDIETELPHVAILFAETEDFFHELRCQNAELPKDSGKKLFDLYFKGLAPFGVKNKKHEFPDAGNLLALLEYSRDCHERIYVVSGDSDWKRICEENEELIYYQHISPIIELGMKLEARNQEKEYLIDDGYLLEWVTGERDHIAELIKNSVIEETLSCSDKDDEIQLYIENISIKGISTIDTSRNEAIIYAEAEVFFVIEYYAIIEYFDSATGMWLEQEKTGSKELSAIVNLELHCSDNDFEVLNIDIESVDGLDLEIDSRI